MKRISKALILLTILLVSIALIAGCAKRLPDNCYKAGVKTIYFCEDGEQLIFYDENKMGVDLIDYTGKKTHCPNENTAPCDIFQDSDYCPRVDVCKLPETDVAD